MDLARSGTEAYIEQNLRAFAANLLRAIRGAGRTAAIRVGAENLLDAFDQYREVVGPDIEPHKLAEMLQSEMNEAIPKSQSPEGRTRERAERHLISGSLQVVASRLLGRKTQESAGDIEIMRGLQRISNFR